ncbi:MAG: CheR family methyltransferase [Prolixibacteraceae bacterium]
MGENKIYDLNQALRGYLHKNLGLNFNENQNKELSRKMDLAATSFGFTQPGKFVEWLLSDKISKEELSKLAGHLTIGETYFMREKKGYDFLEQIYLPGLIHKRLTSTKKLRVWCAGCATGEEAYSLAIVLKQSIPMIQEWDISILATDINPLFLEKAKNGIYTKWSFRNNTEKFIENYFLKTGANEYHIIPEIKRMVKFASLNLAGNDYPSKSNDTHDFDIVFCRNVLIYFSNDGIKFVTERIYQSLKDGGILVVSPVEMSNLISRKFKSIFYSGYTIYHKAKDTPAEKDLKVDRTTFKKQFKNNAPQISTKKESKSLPIPRKMDLVKPLRAAVPTKENANPKANFEKIELFYGQGAFEETEQLLATYLNASEVPASELVHMMAKTKANLGKLQEAEFWCLKGLSINKLDFSLHYLLATIMQETGRDDKAITALKMALYLDSDFVLAYFLLGTLLAKNGDTIASKKAYNNALSSLSKYALDDILPESDGITAGRFTAIIHSITN